MVFSSCKPSRAFRCNGTAARKQAQALKQKLAGIGAYHGVSLRLMLVDKQVDAEGALPHAALDSVHVVAYDSATTTLQELLSLVREAHRQNGAPFLSIAVAHHGADDAKQWAWTSDLVINLGKLHSAMDDLAPVVEVLAAALSKTRAGKAHIDLLACGLATACKGLVPALEKMYGIDFRASTDDTGNAINGGDWKMETDNDYDVAADYLDHVKLKAYSEKMGLCGSKCKTGPNTQLLQSGARSSDVDEFAHISDFEAHAEGEARATYGMDWTSSKVSATAEARAAFEAGASYHTQFGGSNVTFDANCSAHALAQASAKFEAGMSWEGIDFAASAQAIVQADAEVLARLHSDKLGTVDAAAHGTAVVEAFASANANFGPDGASVKLGAKIGASLEGGGRFQYTSPSGALVIKASAKVEFGACFGASFEAGCTCTGGKLKFTGEVAMECVVGGKLALEVTFDGSKLKQAAQVQIQRKLNAMKPEIKQALLEIGGPRSDDITEDFSVEADEIDVLGLAAAAKALFR